MPYKVKLPPFPANDETVVCASGKTTLSHKSGDNGDEGDGREILIDPVVGAAAASLVLVVRTGAPAEPPISIAPAVVVTNPVRFIEATLADLSCYVAARNRGAANWAENLIDEKFEQLRRCGIEAEIKEIQ